MRVQLNDQEDVFIWNDLHQNGKFSVHSLYLALISSGIVETNKVFWWLKVHLKIIFFMWYIYKEVIFDKR
jgi:hypothetical protein